MKYKKYSYILVLILMLVVGINHIHAESYKTCYYISDDNNFKASIRIGYGFESANINKTDEESFARATIWKTSVQNMPIITTKITNWFATRPINGIKVEEHYKNSREANNDTNPVCPKNIIYRHSPGLFGTKFLDSDKVLVTDSSLIAKNIQDADRGRTTTLNGSNYKNGKQITKEEFFLGLEQEGLITYDEDIKEYTCETITELFGDPKDNGDTYDPDKDGASSIRYMINNVLLYVRIIVPILIILLGSIDFAKAVLAGKEDNMRKAQTDFVKRLIAGVVVFLAPILVDVIMDLADIVWQGTSLVPCDF